MAIPDNYIDKITKDGDSRMISPAADKVRVENEHYEGDNLDEVLDEIDEKVSQAIPTKTSQLQNDSGYITEDDLPEGVECDTQMSSSSVKPVQNKVIKAYVDNLIAGLIDGAPAALDTLKELATALGNNSDAYATLINLISSKANASEVVKSISVNGQAPQTPNNGNVNIQVSAPNMGNYYTKGEVDDAIDEKMVDVTVEAVGNSASMYFAGSALCISTANIITASTPPTITTSPTDTTLTITATGTAGASVSLTVGSDTVTGTTSASKIINRGEEDVVVAVSAFAIEDGKAASAPVEETITVLKLPASTAPTITVADATDNTKANATVTINGSGTVKAYLTDPAGGTEVEKTLDANGQFTIAKSSTARNVVIRATAKEDASHSTAETTQTVNIGAYVDESKYMKGYSTNNTPFNVTLGSLVLPAVFDGTKTGDYYNWYVDLSPRFDAGATGVGNATSNTGIFGQTASSANSTVVGITKIPNGITRIGDYAFINCAKLTSILLPSTLSSIGVRAFRSCSLLGTMKFGGETPPTFETGTSNNCLMSSKSPKTFIVPSSSAQSAFEASQSLTTALSEANISVTYQIAQ